MLVIGFTFKQLIRFSICDRNLKKCLFAASHFQARRSGQVQKPSLVICPPILVGHWTLEINKFVGKDVLLPLGYEGSIHVRTSLQKQFQSVDVVIMSYDMLRADSSSLLNHLWNYCILDEGHAIRNPKAKITQVKIFCICT